MKTGIAVEKWKAKNLLATFSTATRLTPPETKTGQLTC
jgi:hypothetical protein